MILRSAGIDILIGQDSTTINVYDREAGIEFLEITLTQEQLCQALSRLSHTPCTAHVRGLDKVGKKQEIKSLDFPLVGIKDHEDPKAIAKQMAQRFAEPGWKADTYFGSQDSFFTQGQSKWARTSQRRWVDFPESEAPPTAEQKDPG